MAAQTDPTKLEDHAATAALYVTKSRANTATAGTTPAGAGSTSLDENGKLSSAGAAASLKYAKPPDLPSYPSQGGVKLSSASAAASLAHANQKSFEHWKPGDITGADKAAASAKNYRAPAPWKPGDMTDADKAAASAKNYQAPAPWKPDISSTGSRAAAQAHRDGLDVDIWRPDDSTEGHRAAGSALRRSDLSPDIYRGASPDAVTRAKLAATGAMNSSRRRAESSPASAPSLASSPSNALKAATTSHASSRRGPSPTIETSEGSMDHNRIHNIARNNVNRQLYTANPSLSMETEEKNRQDTMHASAVAMAKQMYKVQQARIDDVAGVNRSHSHYAATKVHARRTSTASTSTTDEIPSTPPYVNLQEAAQKLAAERLAKIHDEHQAYRNYYGQSSPPRKKLSARPKLRRRASSDSEAAKIDEEQSKKIRSEMSQFQDKLAEVDAKKRKEDRDALLAAAQRNVSKRMSNMDEKVFEDTGKPSRAMVAEWESAAQLRAQADSEARMANHGRVHIGSGKYLDQADVDAIARDRIQPTLDDIAEKAEQQRAKDEEVRLGEEEKKRQADNEKIRATELKAEQKKARDTEKAEEKAKRDLEKSQRAEEKRAQKETEKEEKRKSKEAAVAAKDDSNKDGKRKQGIFGTFGLGSVAAAGATAGAVVSKAAHKVDPTPKTSHVPAEGEPGTEEDKNDEAGEDDKAKAEEVREEAGSHGAAQEHRSSSSQQPAAHGINEQESSSAPVIEETPASPTRPGVKGWLKKLGRRSSGAKREPGFIGGAAVTGGIKDEEVGPSASGPPAATSEQDSMKEVAMAGKASAAEADAGLYSASEDANDSNRPTTGDGEMKKSPSISSLGSEDLAEGSKDRVSPLEPSPLQSPSSPAAVDTTNSHNKSRGRDRISGFLSKGKGLGRRLSRKQKDPSVHNSGEKQAQDASERGAEESGEAVKTQDKDDNDQVDFEEARDTVDTGELAPPPKLTDIISDPASDLRKKTSGSPVRDSRFSEDL